MTHLKIYGLQKCLKIIENDPHISLFFIVCNIKVFFRFNGINLFKCLKKHGSPPIDMILGSSMPSYRFGYSLHGEHVLVENLLREANYLDMISS